MLRRILLVICLLITAAPASAQTDCGLPPLLEPRSHGVVAVDRLNAYGDPTFSAAVTGSAPRDTMFQVNDTNRPVCAEGVRWLQVADPAFQWVGWTPESIDGAYTVARYQFQPTPPIPFDIPVNAPQITEFNTPLPTVIPAPMPTSIDPTFVSDYDWQRFVGDSFTYSLPTFDPLTLTLPTTYMGDLPVPPFDLSDVYFVADAELTEEQLTLLAQNGFVVVPSGLRQFDDAYYFSWDHADGRGDFITTDALLHALFLIYQNTQMFLEMSELYGEAATMIMGGFEQAADQYAAALGTDLEAPARRAALYYTVALALLASGQDNYTYPDPDNFGGTLPHFTSDTPSPRSLLSSADPALLEAAQPIIDLALAAEGRLDVPILTNYQEDFSQYQPRSYYAGNPLLESYFRTLMWLGRITFLTESPDDTLTGLLVLRALVNDADGYAAYERLSSLIDFLVGPVDDLSPADYTPLAQQVYGADLNLNAFANVDNLTAFLEAAADLPLPRVNSIPVAVGALTPEELAQQTRGFRLFGQRFTFDGYAMQQLIYPEVGTVDKSRTLPLGLDIPAMLGSDQAYALAAERGAADYANYDQNLGDLRDEVSTITGSDWLQNLAGAWLWTLQPLAYHDPALIPPMLQTDAWQRRELASLLGSWTQLKHATLLYAEQPMGGLGGGGFEPPVISYSRVEPNPQVFARIALISALLTQGLEERGYLPESYSYTPMFSLRDASQQLGILSSLLAEMARKELAGEPYTYQELYFLQEQFGQAYWYIRYTLEVWITDPPENTALVADVASNAASGEVLHVAIGTPDYIYVVTNTPYGLTLARGAVYSYYEFVSPIDERLTDDEWRALLAAGTQPDRPAWIDLHYAD